MKANIQKVTHYEINLNLSEIEFNVFKSIMSNLKESEVMDAFYRKDNKASITKEELLNVYTNLKSLAQTNIKAGSE